MAESTLNFEDSATVAWSITDDPGNGRYDIQADAVAPAPPASIGAEVHCSSPVTHLSPGSFTRAKIDSTTYAHGVTVVLGPGGYLQIQQGGMYLLAGGLRFSGVVAGDYTDVGFQKNSGAGYTLVGRTQQATAASTFIGAVFAEPAVSYIAPLAAGDKVAVGGSYWGASATANYDGAAVLAIFRLGDVIP